MRGSSTRTEEPAAIASHARAEGLACRARRLRPRFASALLIVSLGSLSWTAVSGGRPPSRPLARPSSQPETSAIAALPEELAPSPSSPAATAPPISEAIPAGPDVVRVQRAIDRGLQWLLQIQGPTGAWSGDVGHKRMDGYAVLRTARSQEAAGEGHLGVTALAGLAFLAAGHHPERGVEGAAIQRAIAHILDHAGETGYLTSGGSRMYSHAFAVLFLAQAYGMLGERRDEVGQLLRRATRFMVTSQNALGAWRYAPLSQRADLSVTVSQMHALRAAREAGLAVPKVAIDRAVDYVWRSQIPFGRRGAGLFYYKIAGRSAKTKTSFTINAAALTCLQSAGINANERLGDALDFLESGYSEVSRFRPNHYYFWYGNWYAAQALKRSGERRFARYWPRLSRDLLARQRADGSWRNSVGPGDAFSTAMGCLLLSVPRDTLPLFHD